MDAATLNTVRLESTSLEMRALRASIEGWFVECAASDVDANGDYRGKYRSQLAALRGMMLGAADALDKSINDLRKSVNEPSGEFYRACREHDGAIVWLTRLWASFRDKYAQRSIGADTRLLLIAADEVLWSCYAQPMRQANKGKRPRSPLAFVEAEYSPAAIMEGRTMPAQLRLETDAGGASQFARSLPVSMLRLPTMCIRSAWWLIFVAHEVGHYLQNDLGPILQENLDLLVHTRDGIKAAVAAQGLNESDADRWARWGEEIFADFISVLLVGPWALWALSEVDRGTPKEMCARRTTYPAPIVRLALMKHALERLGRADPKSPWSMRGIDPEAVAADSPEAKDDLRLVPSVIDFLSEPLPGGKTLMGLCGIGSAPASSWPRAKIAGWRDHMLGRCNLPPEQTAEAARLVVCGAAAAWAEVLSTSGIDQPARDALRESVTQRALGALAASSEPGLRAGDDTDLEESAARHRGTTLASDVLAQLRAHAVPTPTSPGSQ